MAHDAKVPGISEGELIRLVNTYDRTLLCKCFRNLQLSIWYDILFVNITRKHIKCNPTENRLLLHEWFNREI